jgi:DNA-binding NarL/FixJ family response regulator
METKRRTMIGTGAGKRIGAGVVNTSFEHSYHTGANSRSTTVGTFAAKDHLIFVPGEQAVGRISPSTQITAGADPMKSQGVIRVLSVDGHRLFQEGIASTIDAEPDMRLVARASSGSESIRIYRACLPDVTLMDLRLLGLSGIDSLIAIRKEFPSARVIFLTTFDGDSEVQCALRAGARGYFLKSVSPEDLLTAIREVYLGNKRIQPEIMTQIAEHMGEEELSAREVEVLGLVANGQGNRYIGEQLYISEATVKVHLKHILKKLGASDRTHAVALAQRRGIIRLDAVPVGSQRRLAGSRPSDVANLSNDVEVARNSSFLAPPLPVLRPFPAKKISL